MRDCSLTCRLPSLRSGSLRASPLRRVRQVSSIFAFLRQSPQKACNCFGKFYLPRSCFSFCLIHFLHSKKCVTAHLLVGCLRFAQARCGLRPCVESDSRLHSAKIFPREKCLCDSLKIPCKTSFCRYFCRVTPLRCRLSSPIVALLTYLSVAFASLRLAAGFALASSPTAGSIFAFLRQSPLLTPEGRGIAPLRCCGLVVAAVAAPCKPSCSHRSQLRNPPAHKYAPIEASCEIPPHIITLKSKPVARRLPPSAQPGLSEPPVNNRRTR